MSVRWRLGQRIQGSTSGTELPQTAQWGGAEGGAQRGCSPPYKSELGAAQPTLATQPKPQRRWGSFMGVHPLGQPDVDLLLLIL